jgi:type IV pilus assembly protein PilM
MASSSVWAIDIGTNSLKALRLHASDKGYEVIGFDHIEHSKIVSSGEVDDDERRQIIDETLDIFIERNNLGKDEVAISIAGHNSFARFIKLPPVEKKRIPEIVQFEAVQQIPFDINDVEWDWQLMGDAGSPDTEVGLFAIKNELINAVMDHFTRRNIKVACVQISPMALYNFCIYDQKMSENGIVILDMGAENTTLVVCTKNVVWQRSIRIGGNAFTEAIAEAFKLKFAKAEKLKRSAPMSKYVRQIFTAMKPVFTDLGSEIQRSLGFYSSSGKGSEGGFSKVIALGGGMKLQGLAKYLQQTLGVPVVKPESFGKLSVSSDVSSAKFHENISDFGVIYGLGLQMLGEEKAKITVNLLPRKIARSMAWARKGKFFILAACLLLAVSALSLVNAIHNKNNYKGNENVRRDIVTTISAAQKADATLKKEAARNSTLIKKINSEIALFNRRDMIPVLNQTIISCIPNSENNPEQKALYEAFEKGDVEGILSVERPDRKQLFVTNVSVRYESSLNEANFEDSSRKRKKKKQTGGMMGGMMGGFMGPGMMGPGMMGPGMMGPGMMGPGMMGPGARTK